MCYFDSYNHTVRPSDSQTVRRTIGWLSDCLTVWGWKGGRPGRPALAWRLGGWVFFFQPWGHINNDKGYYKILLSESIAKINNNKKNQTNAKDKVVLSLYIANIILYNISYWVELCRFGGRVELCRFGGCLVFRCYRLFWDVALSGPNNILNHVI